MEKHKILCLFSFSNVRCLFCATLFRSGLKYSFEKISFTRKSFFICQSPFSRNTHFGSIVGVVLFPHNNYYVYYIDYIYISLRILLHFGSIGIYQVVLFPQNYYKYYYILVGSEYSSWGCVFFLVIILRATSAMALPLEIWTDAESREICSYAASCTWYVFQEVHIFDQ